MRTFIAIDLSPAVKQQVRTLQQRLQSALRPLGGDHLLKWTKPDKVHVTLRFLGDTGEVQTRCMAEELGRITSEMAPFALQLGGIGVFPNWPRLRVLWVGVDGAMAALHRLQQAVEAAAQAAGFTAEDKSFSPHITLARMGNSARSEEVRRIGEFLRTGSAQETTLTATWRVEEIVHMQSQLRPEGAVYTPIEHFALKYKGTDQS
ncbi:RNA 2',3'-cyclic phosphodiesterase [bacterium]|nr:RNA 2',3'-cyclic phosphodiesterase [bacterium]